MGDVLTKIIPGICPCKDFAKYVCNACHYHSKCSDCCDIDIETTEIREEASETEVQIDGWFYAKKSS